MTIDENGLLYVATWNGGRIIVINPVTKEITREITMPTAKVTSVCVEILTVFKILNFNP